MAEESTDILERLIDIYKNDLEIAECSFEIMGKLLDKACLKKRIDQWNVKKLYIYGGGYLGIHFYQACDHLLEIPAVVDKQGCLQLGIGEIPVIRPGQLQKIYDQELIVVASVRYYQEIKRDLVSFVPESKIVFLGEFLEGMIS